MNAPNALIQTYGHMTVIGAHLSCPTIACHSKGGSILPRKPRQGPLFLIGDKRNLPAFAARDVVHRRYALEVPVMALRVAFEDRTLVRVRVAYVDCLPAPYAPMRLARGLNVAFFDERVTHGDVSSLNAVCSGIACMVAGSIAASAFASASVYRPASSTLAVYPARFGR